MSVPTIPPPSAAPITPNGRKPQRARALVVVAAVFLAAILGPLAAMQATREIGRWQLAAALDLREKGAKDAAYQRLDSAIGWFPSSPELLLQRAEWRLEDGQRDLALADCDKMLEVANENYQWLIVHSQFLWNAGEFARAVEDWKKVNEFSERSGLPPRAEALNGLAYAQALAKVDLEAALEHSNQAIALSPDDPQLLDTRGYILHLLGRDQEAIADMNKAVASWHAQIKRTRGERPQLASPRAVRKILAATVPKTLRGGGAARTTAVIHYHRALVLAALDRQAEADAEQAVVRKLIGRDGDETLF